MSTRFDTQFLDPYEPNPLDKALFMSERLCSAIEGYTNRTPTAAAKHSDATLVQVALFRLFRGAMREPDQHTALMRIFDTSNSADLWVMSLSSDIYERLRDSDDPPSYLRSGGGLFSDE